MRHISSPPPPAIARSSSTQRPPDDAGKNGVNVKVIVRCRPTSELEKRDPSQFQIVTTKVDAKEVFVSQTTPGRKVESYSKTFTFDGVGNQYTTQEELFKTYIVPIVDEVLQGFNCTIFAYGQTGTGKTYTMEGDIYQRSSQRPLVASNGSSSNGACVAPSVADPSQSHVSQIPQPQVSQSQISQSQISRVSSGSSLCVAEHAGVIPRAVQHIFAALEAQETEYSVRVSYLEIYNEELNDLLNDGDKQNLRIFEDPTGKRGLSVDRLEEVPVNNPQDIFNILTLAVKKRRTAETLLNRQSSRSHCIFSVMIHMKETNMDGEDVIKIGKLNLVDLAGSENIQRSGANAVKDRAKEAGMINQSLLTLGRVINALVEHSSYVPYRDSKLTRLLQESLGGRTKTCIVATISPSSLCLEETLSTLDYAFRAKNIRNRPEVNQKMTKRVMIRELNFEIEKLKVELQANREKNGVYLPLERFAEIETRLASQTVELTETSGEMAKLRTTISTSQTELADVRERFRVETDMHATTRRELEVNRAELASTMDGLKVKIMELEKECMMSAYLRGMEEDVRRKCAVMIQKFQQSASALGRIKGKLETTRQEAGSQTNVIDNICVSEQQIGEAFEEGLVWLDSQWKGNLEVIRTAVLEKMGQTIALGQKDGADLLGALGTAFADSVIKFEVHGKEQEKIMSLFNKKMEQIVKQHQLSSQESYAGIVKSVGAGVEDVVKTIDLLTGIVSQNVQVITESQNEQSGKFDQSMAKLQERFNSLRESTSQSLSVGSSTCEKLKSQLSEFEQLQSTQFESTLSILRNQMESSLQSAKQNHAELLASSMASLMDGCREQREALDELNCLVGRELTEGMKAPMTSVKDVWVGSQTALQQQLHKSSEDHNTSTAHALHASHTIHQKMSQWHQERRESSSSLQTTLDQSFIETTELTKLQFEEMARTKLETANGHQKIHLSFEGCLKSVWREFEDVSNQIKTQTEAVDMTLTTHAAKSNDLIQSLANETHKLVKVSDRLQQDLRPSDSTPDPVDCEHHLLELPISPVRNWDALPSVPFNAAQAKAINETYSSVLPPLKHPKSPASAKFDSRLASPVLSPLHRRPLHSPTHKRPMHSPSHQRPLQIEVPSGIVAKTSSSSGAVSTRRKAMPTKSETSRGELSKSDVSCLKGGSPMSQQSFPAGTPRTQRSGPLSPPPNEVSADNPHTNRNGSSQNGNNRNRSNPEGVEQMSSEATMPGSNQIGNEMADDENIRKKSDEKINEKMIDNQPDRFAYQNDELPSPQTRSKRPAAPMSRSSTPSSSDDKENRAAKRSSRFTTGRSTDRSETKVGSKVPTEINTQAEVGSQRALRATTRMSQTQITRKASDKIPEPKRRRGVSRERI